MFDISFTSSILVIVWTFLVIIACSTSTNALLNCDITRHGNNGTGFHREIQTNIIIHPEKNSGHHEINCMIVLKENIPSGLYVDLYQTESLFQFGGPKVYSSVNIDVEKPAFLSDPHIVFVYKKTSRSGDILFANISMPIHVRYRQPISSSSESDYEVLTLFGPDVYISCQPDVDWFSNNTSLAAPCYDNTSLECRWSSLSCQSNSPSILFKVPLGNVDDTNIVVIVTVLVTVLTVLIILLGICSDNKLNNFEFEKKLN